jgi:hypothetical protein
VWSTKKPGVLVTPGPRLRERDVRGRASRPQGIEPERVRRLIGGSLRFAATQDLTLTSGEHGQPRYNECLRPTRLGANLTARPSSCTLTDAALREDVRAISRFLVARPQGLRPWTAGVTSNRGGSRSGEVGRCCTGCSWALNLRLNPPHTDRKMWVRTTSHDRGHNGGGRRGVSVFSRVLDDDDRVMALVGCPVLPTRVIRRDDPPSTAPPADSAPPQPVPATQSSPS